MGPGWTSWLINSECDHCFWEYISLGKGKIIEMVKSELKTSLFIQHQLLLSSQTHD